MVNQNDGPVYDSLRIDRQGQAEAFDALGGRYDEAFPHKEGQVSAGEWLIRSLPAGSRVLDLGCGTGVPTARQMVKTDADDGPIPFLGNTVRVSGYLREDLRKVIEAAGFGIVQEASCAYAPAVAAAPPEEQLFLCCRLRG